MHPWWCKAKSAWDPNVGAVVLFNVKVSNSGKEEKKKTWKNETVRGINYR